MSLKSSLQLTLALIKPDAFHIPHIVQNVHETILSEGFLILRRVVMHLGRDDAERFYTEHEGKFFYNRLVTFMSSGPLAAMVLAREDAIDRWRTLMGPTRVYESRLSHPNTIRGRHGLSDTRNTTHGSDSYETALREINFFFPDFDVKKWNREEQDKFLAGQFRFDEDQLLHKPV